MRRALLLRSKILTPDFYGRAVEKGRKSVGP